VANASGNSVSVLRGNGTGGFPTRQNWSVGSGPRSLTVADFNADGKPDIVTANYNAGTVSIRLGTGNGNFSSAVAFTAGGTLSGIVSVDVNGDGRIDLAVCSSTSGSVGVLLGTGTGSFGAATFFAAGSTPAAIASSDFDGDGLIDLAIANEMGDTATILRGDGAGGFSIFGTVSTGSRPLGIVAADVTGDNTPDLLVANANSNTLTVHRGLGNGTFDSAFVLPAGNFSRALAVADFNGDTLPDIGVANGSDNNVWSILNRGGSFADVSVAVTDAVNSVRRGDSVSYDILVSNLGPTVVDGFTLNLTFPGTLESIAIVPEAGAYDSLSGAWTGLNLSSGQSVTLAVSGNVSATAVGTLTVSASLVPPAGVIDPVSGNNLSQDANGIIQGDADLAVTIADGRSELTAGDEVTYTIVATNSGPINVPNARVVVNIPTQLQNVVWSCQATGGASCVSTDPVPVNDNIKTIDEEMNLPVGGTITLTMTGFVNPLSPAGTLVASVNAVVPADVVDPSSGNNSASDSDSLLGNNAPVANSQSISVLEDSSIAITITGTDADGDSITFGIAEGPVHGSLSGTAPNLTYNPAANYFGADSFVFTASDGAFSSPATVSITVEPVNDAPVVADQSIAINEDVAAAINIAAADPDGNTLTYTVVTPPAFGTLTGTAPALTYTPNPNANGSDSFTFSVFDGTVHSGSATVSIQVNALNDPPAVVTPIPDQNLTGEGTSLSLDLTSTFSDVETPATGLVLSAASADPSLATPVLTGSVLELQLAPNRGGTTTITVRATDPDGGWVEDSFTITVLRPGVHLSVSDASRSEGSSPGLVFTLTLAGPASDPVIVSYTTEDVTALSGADYTAAGGTVTFAPGITARTVTIATVGDLIDEDDETMRLVLSSTGAVIFDDAVGIGTVVDNDTASLSVLDISVNEGDSSSSTGTFVISLSTPSSREITVNYATADISAGAVSGRDYVARAGTLVFPAGSNTPQNVTVDVLGDLFDENNESFRFVLSDAVNATISRAAALANIIDNDAQPSVSISDVSLTEGNSGTKTMNFSLVLSAPSELRTRVRYETADGTALAGSDYVAKTGEVVFEPGVVSRTISISINGNTVAEPNEEFYVNLHTPTNLTIADGQALGTILNDD
jgi:uncharacterized repeat protein (TIGR01451 family)